MQKLFVISTGLAALLMTAACAGNQGGGLVPAPVAPTGTSTLPAAPDGHRDGPDTGSIAEFNYDATPWDFITPDFAGNEWFGSVNPRALVSINENSANFTKYDLPSSYSGPYDLAMNPAHDVLWFTDPGSNSIGYMNLLNHSIGQFTIPTANSYPEGIAAGPDNTMWFAESAAGKIGRINTTTQKITEYNVPSPSKPYRITLGPDGALWFSNTNSIGRITTKGHVHLYSIGQSDPTGITTGPDGGVWFTGKSDQNGSMLGRIDPHTHLRKIYKYAAGDGGNEDLAVRDSDFWMTRMQGNRIDRFDHATHIIHSRPLPQGYKRPGGIALGSDDQLWFINLGAQSMAVGKLCPTLDQGQCKGAF